jgi:hypothetical protein
MKKHELETRAANLRRDLQHRIGMAQKVNANLTGVSACGKAVHTHVFNTIELSINQIIVLSQVQNRLPKWVPSLFYPLFRRQGKINILMADALSQTIRELHLIVAEKSEIVYTETKEQSKNATSK